MSREKFALVGAFIGMVARMVAALGGPEEKPRVRSWRVNGENVPHQGERELARRRRQIERGQLREQNGLIRASA